MEEPEELLFVYRLQLSIFTVLEIQTEKMLNVNSLKIINPFHVNIRHVFL